MYIAKHRHLIGKTMIQKTLIEPWNECVHKVVLLGANSASCVFQGVEEEHEGDTKVERHVHKVVPKLDVWRRPDEEQDACTGTEDGKKGTREVTRILVCTTQAVFFVL